ncbi:hypothetical protein TomTYG75_24290 [Sphingobium sp. TomTYG75]
MRVERRDDDGTAFRAGTLHRAANDSLMTEVKSVKIAQRHDAPAQMGRDRGAAFQPLHGAGYREMVGRWQCGATANQPTFNFANPKSGDAL